MSMEDLNSSSNAEKIAKTMDKKGSAEKMPSAKGATLDKSADVGKKNAAQYSVAKPEGHV